MLKIIKLMLTWISILFLSTNSYATNSFVDLAGSYAWTGINTSGEIMSTPIGGLIYFVIWFLIILFIVGAILWVLHWSKSSINDK